MALSNEERDRVAELLDEHPEWRTGQIREAAGLDSKQLFAVKSLRDKLGVPEPDSGQPKAPRKPRGRPRKGSAPSADTLEADSADEDVPMPSAPGRSKRGGAFKSLLAPAMPTMIAAGAHGLMNFTGRLTRNPMQPAEAAGVVAPLARIGDRFLAKYVKVTTGKATPDAEDVRDAIITIGVYLLRLLADNMAQRAARHAPPPASRAPGMPPSLHTMPTGAESDDLFAGSEPAPMAGAGVASSPADMPDAPTAPRPAPTREGAALAREGIAGPHAGPVDDSFWNAITPTNLGNYEAP